MQNSTGTIPDLKPGTVYALLGSYRGILDITYSTAGVHVAQGFRDGCTCVTMLNFGFPYTAIRSMGNMAKRIHDGGKGVIVIPGGKETYYSEFPKLGGLRGVMKSISPDDPRFEVIEVAKEARVQFRPDIALRTANLAVLAKTKLLGGNRLEIYASSGDMKGTKQAIFVVVHQAIALGFDDIVFYEIEPTRNKFILRDPAPRYPIGHDAPPEWLTGAIREIIYEQMGKREYLDIDGIASELWKREEYPMPPQDDMRAAARMIIRAMSELSLLVQIEHPVKMKDRAWVLAPGLLDKVLVEQCGFPPGTAKKLMTNGEETETKKSEKEVYALTLTVNVKAASRELALVTVGQLLQKNGVEVQSVE